MKKQRLYLLGLITLIGFPLLGIGLRLVIEGSYTTLALANRVNVLLQVCIGICYGLGTAYLGWRIIRMPFMRAVRIKYGGLIHSLNLNWPDIIFISLCAGIGEELLFRAVIQPYLGVWITSLVFVGIHGYINPKDWRLSIYGIYMTLVIAGIGYFAADFGIVSAIIAHIFIDILLLYYLNHNSPYESD